MSADLYPTRLYWCGHWGVAKLDGVSSPITAAPMLGKLRTAMVDYTPKVNVYQVMPYGEGWRDMRDDEKRHALALLKTMAKGVA